MKNTSESVVNTNLFSRDTDAVSSVLSDTLKDDNNFLTEAVKFFSGDNYVTLGRFFFSNNTGKEDPVNGIKLWDAFTRSPNYYVTRNEVSLIKGLSGKIAKFITPDTHVVEFGPGSWETVEQKTLSVLKAAGTFSEYITIDLSENYARESATLVKNIFPSCNTRYVHKDFCDPYPLKIDGKPRVGLFFGTTIGNICESPNYLFPSNTTALLKSFGLTLGKGAYLVITQDTNQDKDSLFNAYGSNICEEFRMNVLYRIQRDLVTLGFDPSLFSYSCEWNKRDCLFDGYACATENQSFYIGQEHFIKIKKGQKYCLAKTYKYSVPMFKRIANEAGFDMVETHMDHENRLALHILKVR